jgi:hypothetical protein
MKLKHALIALVASMGTMASSEAAILYADDFSEAGSLHGTTPDTTSGGATWTSGTAFLANGTVSTTPTSGAWLPFIPTAGNIYTVSSLINTTAGGQNWISLGFSAAATALPNNRFADGAVVALGTFLLRQNRGSGTGSTDSQFFIGETTSGPVTSIAMPPLGAVSAKITLDASNPSPALWTLGLSLNGSPITLVGNSNPLDGSDPGTTVSNFGDIKFVGFTVTNTAGGTIDDFQVEVTPVPEPSAALLAALGTLTLLHRRRS